MRTLALAGIAAAALAITSVPVAQAGHHDHGRAHKPYMTIAGMPSPLVVSHRGASGYRPEHTIAAYDLAVRQGADYIEPDLVMTKDGRLVDRHEPEISGTTDVAKHPEFAARKTTKMLDGVATTGWFTEDFTLAELKTLRCVERLPQIRQENTIFDGRYQITTFEEDLALREQLSKKYGRTIGIVPEIKHSTYFHERGFNPEKAVMALIGKYDLNRRNAPLVIQSFEYTNLVDLRTRYGLKAQSTFLMDSTGAPYDLVKKGDKRTYDDLAKPAQMRRIARFATMLSPHQARVIPLKDGVTQAPTSFVRDAHRAGLQVVPWTIRAENTFLPKNYQLGTNPADFGRAIDYMKAMYRTGIDGLFSDQPDLLFTARAELQGTAPR